MARKKTKSEYATQATKPHGLGKAGSKLWDDIVADYSLNPDRVRMLYDACLEADIVDRVQAELNTSPLQVEGSMGQLVPSPLLSEIRQHRANLQSLLKALSLPLTSVQAEAVKKKKSDDGLQSARKQWKEKAQTPPALRVVG